MVFSAVPVYLDPPNWQQQDQQIGVSGNETPLLLPTTATSSSSIRPEQALITAVQPPEPALNCPRCESTNTKFCYYNNYSRSQPRHFCKTCRRYWTRGGALRNVPVGGGCRRNKRSKNNTRSPPAATSSGAIAITNASTSGSAVEALELDQHQIPPPPPLLPFISTLHQFTNFTSADVGMPFTGIHPLRSERLGGSGGGGDMDYAAGQSSGSTIGQWRLQHPNQHFSIAFSHADGMTGMESAPAPTAGLFPLDAEAMDQQQYLASDQLGAKPTVSNLSSIKLEENQNLPRQFLGLQHGSDQYSSANNAWTDLYLSGFNSSTSPLL